MLTRTLPRPGIGRNALLLCAAALVMTGWYFQPPSSFSGAGGFSGEQNESNQIPDLSGAQINGAEPQPYYGQIPFAPDAVLVAFQPAATTKERAAVLVRHGLSLDPNFRPNPYFARLKVSAARNMTPTETVEATVAALKKDPSVRIAEPDYQIKPDQTLPNDASFGQQWDLHNTGQSGGTNDADIDWPEAWPRATGSPVTVAVCDDGVQYTHPDLAANIWSNPDEIAGNGIDDDANGFIDDTNGWDFATNDRDPMPTAGNSHGTHVAGTVGAVTNNGIGVAGTAPNVRIMCMRMYSGQSTWMSALIQSIDYARQNGASIITVSYNIDGYTHLLIEAIQRAAAADVIYVNSAGNSAQNIDTRRGVIKSFANNVVFVASTTRLDQLSSFSNFGTSVDIAAPGSDILSTVPGNTYGLSSGTSMAAPHMAGALAAVRAKFPGLSARGALDRIINTSDDMPSLNSIAGGRINLNAALAEDNVAPGIPSNVRNTHYSSDALKILFEAPGDDGMVGQVASYDVRVNTTFIHSGNFATSRRIYPEIAPTSPGQTATMVVNGLSPGKTYYVAMQAIDDVGNRSAIVFGKSGMTTRPLTIFESAEGVAQFTAVTGPWAMTNSQAASGLRSWTDSPSGDYANNLNIELRSNASYPVVGTRILRFAAKMTLETGFDFLHVEVSADNGTTWTGLGRLTGQADWRTYSYPLTEYAGQSLRVRFRMTTNGSGVRDGVYIDDVYFAPASLLHSDNMETSSTFTSGSSWGWVTDKSVSPTHSWTDSPAGNHGSNVDHSLNGNSVIGLDGFTGALVHFKGWVDLQQNFDLLRVRVARDGGAFTEVGQVSGEIPAWANYSFGLGDALTARLGFRLTTNPSTVNDGVWIDDIRVVAEKWYSVSGPRPGDD